MAEGVSATLDARAARQDLEALKTELETALAENSEDSEVLQKKFMQMLQEANTALEGTHHAHELQPSQPVVGVRAGCKRKAPHVQDGHECRHSPSRTRIAAIAAPDFLALAAKHACLHPFVTECNGKGVLDFRDWNAVHALARAHLHEDFDVHGWSVPSGHLIPAIPNRLSYVLWIDDLLQLSNSGSKHIRGLDIGCGSNLIYPLLGASAFGWQFMAADSEQCAVDNASYILEQNHALKQLISMRLCSQWQRSSKGCHDGTSSPADVLPSSPAVAATSDGDIGHAPGPLMNAVQDGEEYDFCMCNPPFFTTIDHAKQNTRTDFGGTRAEMACDGGEQAFTRAIVADSLRMQGQVHWYTTMFGKKATFRTVRKYVKSLSAVSVVRSLEFAPSQAARWLLAWSFTVPRELALKPLQGLAVLPQQE